jgi:hypothetical protein
MPPNGLTHEENLACSVILGAFARQATQKGSGLVLRVELGIATPPVLEACLRRIRAKEGWSAVLTSTSIEATRDKPTRRAIF